ncbi:MAG: hypothetical protein HOH74_17415, partial [Gemmatimonadetes bacterium]|nr:hypothetical protein [Gemmatimonadota bacterium]
MIPHSCPTLGEEEARAAARVVQSGHVAQGREVEAFEAEVAERLGRTHAVAVSSGTVALGLTLSALNVAEGRVLMPSYVCSALLHATRQAGAQPALADVADDGNLAATTAVSEPLRAIIVPHLFGQPAPVAAIAGAGVPVIEDLAMALGTRDVGGEGIAAVCSFYATKVITSAGEGGMVVTDDAGLAREVRSRREYDGQDPGVLRWNAKLTDVAAAVGRIQLRRLDEFVAARRHLADAYRTALASTRFKLPPDQPAANHYRFVLGLPEGWRLPGVLDRMRSAGV